MTSDMKRRWIEALRSGRYRQARGALRVNVEYPTMCCLGVLCDIHRPTEWVRSNSLWYHGGHHGSLPAGMIDDLGLRPLDESKLIRLNDDRGWTFNGIANWIEANIPTDAPRSATP